MAISMGTERRYTFMFDVAQRKPACELLQAIAKCDYRDLRKFFAGSTWLVQPTPGMRRVSGTESEWRLVAGLTTKEKHGWR